MKAWVYSFLWILGLQFVSAPASALKLKREWARSTLQSEYLGFRQLNKMSPLLTENLVIQGNAIDGIRAFHRKSGQHEWERAFKNGVEGGAVLGDGKVYFGANDGNFYCLDAETGKTLWTTPLNSETLTAPVIQGGSVYHLTGDNTLRAFDASTGNVLWVKTRPVKALMTVRGQTQPLFADGMIYAGFSDGIFAAYDATNGFEKWTKRIGDDKKFNDVDASARIYKDCVLVASYANALYCLNKTTGSVTWQHDFGGFIPVTVVGDQIFYPTVQREIHVLDAPSGKLLKKIVLKKGLSTEVVSYKDMILYGQTKGPVVVRDKDSLEIVDTFSSGRGLFATPTVDSGRGEIFIHSNEANLFKLKLRADSRKEFPWSKR